jgi:hypothetical protein
MLRRHWRKWKALKAQGEWPNWVEVIAKPASMLTINASVGYTDAKYTFLDPAVQVTSAPTSFQRRALTRFITSLIFNFRFREGILTPLA